MSHTLARLFRLTQKNYKLLCCINSPNNVTVETQTGVSTTGVVTAGATYIRFTNTGGSPVTVNGTTLAPGGVMEIPGYGNLLPEISYNASGSTLDIFVLRLA